MYFNSVIKHDQLPDIKQYLDYRLFLSDYYQFRKQRQSFFSYQMFAEKLGVDPSNLAKACLQQRHIPCEAIASLSEVCGFNDSEYRYLKILHEFSRCRNPKKTQELFEQLMSLQSPRSLILEASQYSFYSRWYNPALFTLLGVRPFCGTYVELAGLLIPRITAKEAEESIELLQQLGLIAQAPDGTWNLTHRNLTTGDKWTTFAVQKFQKAAIQLGLDSVDRFPKELRDISTLTLTLSPKDLEEIRGLAKEFRRQVIRIADRSQDATRVYHCNMQVFPLTQILESKP